MTSVSIEESLRRAADAIGWKDRKPGPESGKSRGKGLACSWWLTTGGSSGVYVKINPDGTVTVVSGAVELGTGAMTGAAQILAEELGVDLTDINATDVDTHLSPYDYGAQGSRTAFSVGNACIAAAKDLRRQIGELVAPLWNVAPKSVRLEGKGVVSGNNRLSLAEVAGLSQRTGGGLISHGTFIQPMPTFDPTRVKNHPSPAWTSHSFHTHAVDLSVDDVTGEVSIGKFHLFEDSQRRPNTLLTFRVMCIHFQNHVAVSFHLCPTESVINISFALTANMRHAPLIPFNCCGLGKCLRT